MCKKTINWLLEHFREFSIMNWIFGITLTNVSGYVIGVLGNLSAYQVVIPLLLLLITILSGVASWRERGRIRGRMVSDSLLDALNGIPNEVQDEAAWKAWLLKMQTLLRSRGLKRQWDILSVVISPAALSDRPEIATIFLRGLAQTAKDNPKALGM